MNSKTAYIWEVIFEYFPLITHPATQVSPFMLTNRIHDYLKIKMSIGRKFYAQKCFNKILNQNFTHVLRIYVYTDIRGFRKTQNLRDWL